MPYKPTGRPPGRPKTKEYRTLLARVPLDLVDRVTHYARLHRLPIADLIRDGLEWRITEGNPRQAFLYDPNTTMYDRQSEALISLPEVDLTPDMLDLDTLPFPATPPRAVPPEASVSAIAPVPVVQPAPSVPEVVETRPAAGAYDPAKFTLGKLCPRRHEYGHTGQTLRTIKDRRCYACEREQYRATHPPAPDYDPAKFSLGPLCAKEGHAYRNTGQSLRTKHDRCRLCLNEANEKSRQRKKEAVSTSA